MKNRLNVLNCVRLVTLVIILSLFSGCVSLYVGSNVTIITTPKVQIGNDNPDMTGSNLKDIADNMKQGADGTVKVTP